MWSLTLRAENKLHVFENKVLRKIFGSKKGKASGQCWPCPWLRQLLTGFSPWRSGFATGSDYVEFVVEKVELGQVFL
jgi:hypothetical protein